MSKQPAQRRAGHARDRGGGVVHVRGTGMMAARVPRRVPRRVPPRGCVCAWEGSGGEEDHRAHFDWGKVWATPPAGFPCGRSHCGRAVVVRVCARCGFRCPRAARGRAVGLLGRGRRGRANGVPEITSFWLSVVRPEYKPINSSVGGSNRRCRGGDLLTKLCTDRINNRICPKWLRKRAILF
jgi:hypothetical protein